MSQFLAVTDPSLGETRQLSLLVDGPRVRVSGTTYFPYLNETLRVIISAVLETADDRQTPTPTPTTDICPSRSGWAIQLRARPGMFDSIKEVPSHTGAQYSTVQYSTVQYSAAQYRTVQCVNSTSSSSSSSSSRRCVGVLRVPITPPYSGPGSDSGVQCHLLEEFSSHRDLLDIVKSSQLNTQLGGSNTWTTWCILVTDTWGIHTCVYLLHIFGDPILAVYLLQILGGFNTWCVLVTDTWGIHIWCVLVTDTWGIHIWCVLVTDT